MSTSPVKPLPPPFPEVPVSTPFPDEGAASKVSFPWINFFQQLQDKVRQLSRTPGPYANDAAAKTAGVRVGQQYYQASGAVVIRLT